MLESHPGGRDSGLQQSPTRVTSGVVNLQVLAGPQAPQESLPGHDANRPDDPLLALVADDKRMLRLELFDEGAQGVQVAAVNAARTPDFDCDLSARQNEID